MGVGMPQALYLDEFASQIKAAFGDFPYLVGSCLKNKRDWRDVDVRLILADDVYAAMELGDPVQARHNQKWVSLCLAYSALGKSMTGLPIDFQIQQRTDANREFNNATGENPRSAIGYTPLRMLPYLKGDQDE